MTKKQKKCQFTQHHVIDPLWCLKRDITRDCHLVHDPYKDWPGPFARCIGVFCQPLSPKEDNGQPCDVFLPAKNVLVTWSNFYFVYQGTRDVRRALIFSEKRLVNHEVVLSSGIVKGVQNKMLILS